MHSNTGFANFLPLTKETRKEHFFKTLTWNLSNESRTRMTPPTLDEIFSNHRGNSSTSLTGSEVNAGGEDTCCIS